MSDEPKKKATEAPAAPPAAPPVAPVASTPAAPPVVAPPAPPPAPASPPVPGVVLTKDTAFDYVNTLLRRTLPLTSTSSEYAVIYKDVLKSFSPLEYSGALVHWVLWNAGVRLREFMCREEPADFIKYVADASVQRIWRGSRPPFTRFKLGDTPAPGDVLVLGTGQPTNEYLAIFIEANKDGSWTIAEGGIRQPDNNFVAQFSTVKLEHRNLGPRTLMGWYPLAEMLFQALPK
jgi:hypothetical protein